jgi:hypothetical protein
MPILLFCLGLILQQHSSVAEYPPSVYDKPFTLPSANAYYLVWFERSENLWHVQWTARNRKDRFEGTLQPDADGDVVISRMSSGRAYVRNKLIFFQCDTENQSGELTFAVKDNGLVKFQLGIDGKVYANAIFIGKQGEHPKTPVFTVFRKALGFPKP